MRPWDLIRPPSLLSPLGSASRRVWFPERDEGRPLRLWRRGCHANPLATYDDHRLCPDGQSTILQVGLWSHFVHLLINSTCGPGMALDTKITAGIMGLRVTSPQHTPAATAISDGG